MKYFTTLTLGLLSLNAFALPVLTEIKDGTLPFFKDHSNPEIVHFIPDEAGISLDASKTPLFYLEDGFMNAFFELKKSPVLQKAIDDQLKDGKKVSVVPVMLGALNVSNHEGYFSNDGLVNIAGQFNHDIAFSTSLTDAGKKYLPEILRTKPESVKNFSACYTLSGVSPDFDASVKFDAEYVNKFLAALSYQKPGLTKSKINRAVRLLILSDRINLSVLSGETSQNDYAAAITDRLIPLMTEAGELNMFQIKKPGTIKGEVSFDLKGREDVMREYCIAINLGALKMFPELIN